MPRPKKTPEEIQVMREKIQSTAIEILQDEGFHAVTSRSIAAKLGMSHMSLFTYFENQLEIFSSMANGYMERINTHLDTFVERAKKEDILPLVEETWQCLLEFILQNPALHRLTWSTFGAESIDTNPGNDGIISRLAKLLVIGMERGAFEHRNPQLAAITFIGCLNMPFVLHHTGKVQDISLRDQLVDEGLVAAIRYLEKKK